MKMTDSYAYYQERQNQILKAYELMDVYKTVDKVEKEIKEAQDYLILAEEYYNRPVGGRSPGKAEYDYIKRLVDDGQPVVLSKQMRKALKMKDDDETFNQAMKDDLKASGYNKDEIQDIVDKQDDKEQNYSDHSSIDSADKRKSKLLSQLRMSNEGGNAGNDVKPKKLVSKKERARLAFKAERSRQNLLKPKDRPTETVW